MPQEKPDNKQEQKKSFKSKESFGTLGFPGNLGLDYTHPDYVMFTIVERPGASLKKTQAAIPNQLKKNIINNKQADLSKQQKATLTKIVNGNKDKPLAALGDILVSGIKKDLEREGDNTKDAAGSTVDNSVLILGSLFDAVNQSKNAFDGSTNPTRQVGNILLPMPDNLTYAEQTEWQGADLGAIGGLAKNGLSNTKDLAGAGFSQLGTIISGGAGALVSSVLGGGVLGGALVGALGGGNVLQGTIESTFRIKSNPFKEQTFQGVPFRPFDFSWTFSPTSYSETLEIQEIINTFREYTKPTYKDLSKFQFLYPHELNVKFYTKSEDGSIVENEYLPKLKPCICKSINTNFATAGWHSFTDGAPTSITLQMQFEEIEIITAGDVSEGF
jgi:hypothetical protein